MRVDLLRITEPTIVIGGTKDFFYSPELFEGNTREVADGRAHILTGWGHNRVAQSSTTNLALGFVLG